jgi:hypothetical protein
MVIAGQLERKFRRILKRAEEKASGTWASYGEYGNCWFNAQTLALSDSTGTILYHEGYLTCRCGVEGCDVCFTDNPTVPHAFCTIDGVVVDPTLQLNRQRTYKIAYTFPHERIVARQRQCEKEGHTRIKIGDLPGTYHVRGITTKG